MAVFPVMPSFGYSSSVEFRETLRVYDDLNHRSYLKSTAAHTHRALSFEELSKTEKDSIEAFFIARKQASGSDREFFVYDPDEVDAIDISGVSTTGRHTAIFTDTGIAFTRSGPCTWSGQVNVLFLN
ncbi:MAG: hypothetical protein L0229_20195 [Blastocatellia bacterium]|nr:hypothetical protein [Blastocatellia bacterium]